MDSSHESKCSTPAEEERGLAWDDCEVADVVGCPMLKVEISPFPSRNLCNFSTKESSLPTFEKCGSTCFKIPSYREFIACALTLLNAFPGFPVPKSYFPVKQKWRSLLKNSPTKALVRAGVLRTIPQHSGRSAWHIYQKQLRSSSNYSMTMI